MRKTFLPFLATASLAASPMLAQATAELPAAASEVAAATALAHDDLKTPLFLCRADSGRVVMKAHNEGIEQWLEPIKLFDNLYYVGNRFVGSYILKTGAGLILFDAGTSGDAVRDHIVPGLQKLGLDPKDIKYVIVTHGHWDHFGGGAYYQQTYGAHVGLSAQDWTFIETAPREWREIAGQPIPKHDLVIADGQKLTLGDTTLTLYVTPGHTPGTVSAIVPVKDKGRTRIFSLLGSTAFPGMAEPYPHNAGLKAYDASVIRFARISADARAEGLLNTHAFADGGLERLEAAAKAGSGAPLMVGGEAVARYYGILDHCLRAAIVRAESDPTPKSF